MFTELASHPKRVQMTRKILVYGSIAFDTVALFKGQFKKFILPQHIESLNVSFSVSDVQEQCGGCAGNISHNIHLLGGKAYPIATVGKDAVGYLSKLHELEINTSYVVVLTNMLTARSFITTDLDGNQITTFYPGAMVHSANNMPVVQDASWAIVAPDSKDAILKHAEYLHIKKIPFLFDPGQSTTLFDSADLMYLLSLADALVVNTYEIKIIEQRTSCNVRDIVNHIDAVIITCGADGSWLHTQEGSLLIPPVKTTKAVDPTGCGDAHRAGLLYGLVSNWNWFDSCCLGNLMGSIKVAFPGPQNHILGRDEINSRLHSEFGLSLPVD